MSIYFCKAEVLQRPSDAHLCAHTHEHTYTHMHTPWGKIVDSSRQKMIQKQLSLGSRRQMYLKICFSYVVALCPYVISGTIVKCPNVQ